MESKQESAQFEFGFACDVGRKRRWEPNQDALEVVLSGADDPWHPPLLLIADGLGRHFGGALASQFVVKTFKQEFEMAQHPADYLSLMESCAQAAHQEIRTQGARDPKLASMGSTLVAVTLAAQQFFLLNVGDTRAYILRDKKTLQVSQDQSWVAAQVRAGVLTEQEARTHPNRNRLTMAITAKRTEIKPYVAEDRLELQDILLLCSDGLWGVVPETLIQAATTELPPQAAADKLVALANSSRGPDNISVIIARRIGAAGNITRVPLEDTDL
jgi:PPM family protein phosphatase